MLNVITANELKVKGVSALDKLISDQDETLISVRGKNKYVVLSIEKYNHLRECELESALMEAKKDMAEGRYHTGTVDEHIRRITDA